MYNIGSFLFFVLAFRK